MERTKSNDAKTLFYSRSSGGGYSLWSIDLESGLQTQYSEGFNPCFVPGKTSKELFVTRSAKNSSRTEIWKIDLESGSETQVRINYHQPELIVKKYKERGY